MNGKLIKIKDARCQSCDLVAPVTLAASATDDEKKLGFQIEVYTGQPVRRFWGMLAIDIDGIRARDAMPVLKEHNREAIVGYTSKAWKDKSFFVKGQFSQKTQAAQEAKDLAEEGFPWQASMGIRPLKVMELESGAETKVNGRTIKGPADIWLESEVLETSFVALGADSQTSVSTFAKNFKEPGGLSGDEQPGGQQTRSNPQQQEGNNMEITLKLLQEEAPELLAQIQDEANKQGRDEWLTTGAENERARIQAVSDQSMPGHEDLITKLMYDGKTTGPEAAVQILSAEKKIRGRAAQNLESDSQPPVDNPAPPEGEEEQLESPVDSEGNFDREKATELFNKTPSLKKEFGNDLDTYLAYAQATAGGHVKELKNRA